MEALVEHIGTVALLDYVNLDTDQIIPKQFLKRVERSGYEKFLFYDWRYTLEGEENPSFELNYPEYQGASVLVTGENFGCGSSREHAVWALFDYGFRVLISTKFSDIFYRNCIKNGILPARVSSEVLQKLIRDIKVHGSFKLTANLEIQELSTPTGNRFHFEIDPIEKNILMAGKGEIDQTLEYIQDIESLEARQKSKLPWLWKNS